MNKEWKPVPYTYKAVDQMIHNGWSDEKILTFWKNDPMVNQDKEYASNMMIWLENFLKEVKK